MFWSFKQGFYDVRIMDNRAEMGGLRQKEFQFSPYQMLKRVLTSKFLEPTRLFMRHNDVVIR